MKVLHLIDSAGLYGAEVMLLNLAGEQIQLGLEPIIGSIGDLQTEEKAVEREALRRGLRVEKFRMRPGPNLLGALKMLHYVRANGFNVVHSHGYKSNILLGFIPKSIRHIPVIATIHGWTNIGKLTRMKIYEWVDARSLRRLDAVVLVGPSLLSHPNVQTNGTVNLTVINNSLPPAVSDENVEDEETNRELIRFCRAGFTVGTVGRLSPEKGHIYLIDAIGLMQRSRDDIRLVIIGDGPDRQRLSARIAALSLQSRVLLPGYQSNARCYMQHFDVFALPSLTEGSPITLLEAMQERVPIVSTRVGSVPDVLDYGKAGLLVEPSNAQSLATALCSLSSGADLTNELTTAAYRRVTTLYSSRTMALKYSQVYESVIHGRSLPRNL